MEKGEMILELSAEIFKMECKLIVIQKEHVLMCNTSANAGMVLSVAAFITPAFTHRPTLLLSAVLVLGFRADVMLHGSKMYL